MEDFFQLEILVTAIFSGFISWFITWRSFKREQKKEEKDRLRQHLIELIKGLHEMLFSLDKYEDLINDIDDSGSFNEKTNKELDFVDEKILSILKELDIHYSILHLYDLEDFIQEIKKSTDKIDDKYSEFEETLETQNLEEISIKIREFNQLFEDELFEIVQKMRKVFPK